METVLKRGDAASLPRLPRESAEAPIALRWRRIARRFYKFAERLPESYREPPPEWFRYPLP